MCGISCSSRNVALVHFQDVHADTSMVCVACDMLFDDATKVLDHYSSQHPNRLPPELKKVPNYDYIDIHAFTYYLNGSI